MLTKQLENEVKKLALYSTVSEKNGADLTGPAISAYEDENGVHLMFSYVRDTTLPLPVASEFTFSLRK